MDQEDQTRGKKSAPSKPRETSINTSSKDGVDHAHVTYAVQNSDTTATSDPASLCECSGKLDCILKKLKKLDLLELLSARLDKVEGNLTDLNKDVEELKDGINFMDEVLGGKAESKEVRELTRQVDDLSNRLRRNNLVFLHVPEGSESGSESCASFIKSFLGEQMKVQEAENIEIERAHRTPRVRTEGRGPRPIHVAFLRHSDKNMILKAAPKALKNNPYKDHKVFVTEDFSPLVQKKRREMLYFKRLLLQENPERRVFLTYPATLKLKEGDGWKIFSADDANSMKYLYQNFGRRP